MVAWSLCAFLLFLGLRGLLPESPIRRGEQEGLLRTIRLLHELQETLEAGVLPDQARWRKLAELPAPWGVLAHESVEQLRKQGSPLLPTLRRLRALAEEHLAALREGRARAAQALAQSLVCATLVPCFGLGLYLLLPGLSDRTGMWILLCGIALAAAGAGALWLFSLAENARWGGLDSGRRDWPLAAQCTGERFLALVRGGTPPDLAWTGSCEFLAGQAPELAAEWGGSVWSPARAGPEWAAGGGAAAIVLAGAGIRKAIQASLAEGRPCTERVEAALLGLRQELRALVERELGLLQARALKPLFICVAPALLGLLAAGLWFGAADAILLGG